MQDEKMYRKLDAVLKSGNIYTKWRFMVRIACISGIYSFLSSGYNIFSAHIYAISKLLNRLILLKIVLILAMISSLLLSPNLWINSRLYPQIPIISLFPTLTFPYDYIILFSLFILLLVNMFINSHKCFIALTIIAGIYTLFDQSRLQPEFYQFLLMFITLSIYPWDNQHNKYKPLMLNICCFIVASTYVYSGMQKINVTFIMSIFPWFIEPVSKFFPEAFRNVILFSGIFVPFIETGIGIGLLTQRLRPLAVITAIGMHLLILFSLGPFGHNWNSVIWPWNIAMCCFVFILFWQNKTFSMSSLLSLKAPFGLAIFILCGILPMFSFFNLWDSYLSASLYSGNTKTAQLYIRHDLFSHLNIKLQYYISKTVGEYSIIDFNRWSVSELNVPAYPETRIFKSIAKSFCHQVLNPSDIILSIQEKPDWSTGKITTIKYSCNSL